MLLRLEPRLEGLVLALLAVTLVIGVAPSIDARLVRLGSALWPGYAAELRTTPASPSCDAAALKGDAERCTATAAPAPSEEARASDDPFAPRSGAGDDVDPFAAPAAATDPSCAALRALADRCAERWRVFDDVQARVTLGLRLFRFVEGSVASVAAFPLQRHLLVVLLLACALLATGRRGHLALAEPRTALEDRLAEGAQLTAHLAIAASAAADAVVQARSAAESDHPALPYLWLGGALALAGVNVAHLVRPAPAGAWLNDGKRSSILRAVLVVPLFTAMVLVGAGWFLLVERHASGLAIYLGKMASLPTIYLGVALFVWAGMLFSRTRVAATVFAALGRLGLPPLVLTGLVVVVSAVPTAFSGASGIFVLAAGGVLFDRLRKAGVDGEIALAATAMAGSLGVVLRPCLLVVLIAMLNKEVTTQELYGAGHYVLLVTASLTAVALFLFGRRRAQMVGSTSSPRHSPDENDAHGGSPWRPLAAYTGVGALVVLVLGGLFDVWPNEQTAPWVLPILVLAFIGYERRASPGQRIAPVLAATGEAATHIGALLTLMAASVCLGGVVERAEVLEALPAGQVSPFVAMAFLVVGMVVVGMILDPLGAVALVSVTAAPVALAQGIDPVHFWMMVLVAFELGYVTPPVALNQLLAQKAVGRERLLEEGLAGVSPLRTSVLLPISVLATALLLVAFVPLWWGQP